VQLLNEIANVTRRKMGMSWPETRAFVSLMRGLLPVQPVTIELHETGLRLAARHGLSIYDAVIAASALHTDCDTLLSEDLRDGMVLDGLLRANLPGTPRALAASRGHRLRFQPALRNPRARATASGSASMTRSKVDTGPDGRRRPCSYCWTVSSVNPNRRANCAWLNPNLFRSARTCAGDGGG
jgi:hypothetical protein